MGKHKRLWKIIQTLWIFWAFFMPGIGDAVLGPTLLDLELLVSEGTGNFSFIILSTGLGTVLGSILAPLFSGVDVRLRLCVTLLLGSVVNIVLSLVASFAYLLVMFTLQGIAKGVVVVFLIELCNTLWEEKGVAFQFILSGSMAGAVIAPLLVQPFLCHKQHIHDDLTLNSALSDRNLTDSTHNLTQKDTCTAEDTRVHLAYVLLGCITMPCALAFGYYWIQNGKGDNPESVSPYRSLDSSVEGNHKCLYYVFLVFLFLYFFPIMGNVILYGTFLTAFGVHSRLHMTKESMVMMTSLLFACSLIGRIFNTAATKLCGTLKIIVVNGLAMLITSICLAVLGPKYETALWICSAAFGFSSSPFMGAGFAWTVDHITLRPRIVSFCVFSISVGNMVLPFLGGIMFQNQGPVTYIYLVCSTVVFQVIIFIVLFGVARLLQQTGSPLRDNENEIIVESEQ
ncbi:sodium-dependent glucose transporter 1A-like [Gigantopelta aegis]|uniref:sodium-dependent glucose transporter 1A-like n=1 Tax=Gigantopelta aegis TaxID=1735272 RepID=UPI001B88E4A1|nr:sodium-dependent glucose transporter 1A-like [Gigantopelta aegis]XP_041360954.1 sodium-dependent glucose transporter 1A-like [Gigantopelta aegis]XP_041360955.1 sodium-dependent glucose transporter 1A-like [Gigantopelta aegis]